MVAHSNFYFGGDFKAQRGGIHSNPLSPTIFNIVVDVLDAVLRHWVSVVAEAEAEAEAGLGVFFLYVQLVVAYFYADGFLLASMRSEKLQREFDVLVEIFYQFYLRTNVGKKISMVC